MNQIYTTSHRATPNFAATCHTAADSATAGECVETPVNTDNRADTDTDNTSSSAVRHIGPNASFEWYAHKGTVLLTLFVFRGKEAGNERETRHSGQTGQHMPHASHIASTTTAHNNTIDAPAHTSEVHAPVHSATNQW